MTWPRVPLRRVARLGSGHTPSRSVPEYWHDCTIPWLTLADVGQLRDGTVTTVTATKELISDLGVRNSSAVVHPAGTVALSRTASIGFACILGTDMATSQDFATWECGPRLVPRYLLWGLRGLRDEIVSLNQGSTHKTIYMPDIEQIGVPLPPVVAQRAIADHLDAETARIDELVGLRARSVALLDERRIRLAFDLVVGAEVPGRRKESRVGWLGSVPEAWDVPWVSARFDVLLGRMVNAERTAAGDMRPYLRNANVRWGHVDVEDVARMDFPARERALYRLEEGDLLVCEGGAGVGRAAVWRDELDECYFQKSLHRVRPRGRWPVEWLIEWLRVTKHVGALAVEGNLATIPHLTAEQLRAHRVPMPGPEECVRMLTELNAASATIDRHQALLTRQIELLQEHRQALITAAVTGQLAIPGVTAA